MHNEVILIGQAELGDGDPKLGNIILANFLRLLAERSDVPRYIILWNQGVTLAQEGSGVIEHLSKLQERGVEIVSCQTCVEYFALEDKIGVGEIGNMPRIQDILLTHRVLTV